MATNRAVPAASHTPQLGEAHVATGAQNSDPSPLRKLRPPKVSSDVRMQTLQYKVIFILLNTFKLLMNLSLKKTDLGRFFMIKP